MYAIIETGGKQYRVSQGDTLLVEKLPFDEGAEVVFDRVLLVEGEDPEEIRVGQPTVENATVIARVQKNGRGKKIVVFKYKSKKNYRRKQGHRQPYTQIKIEKIEA